MQQINTEQKYQDALARIEVLMDAREGTSEAEELEELAIAVEKYEDIHFPIMNKAAKTLIKYSPRKNNLIFGYIHPETLLLGNVPDLHESPMNRQKNKILLTHTCSEHIMMNGFVTDIPLFEVWNIVKRIQYFYDDLGGELIDNLVVVYLLCKHYNCIPKEDFPSQFDCQLNMHENWEQGFMCAKKGILPRSINIDFDISDDVKDEIKRIFNQEI